MASSCRTASSSRPSRRAESPTRAWPRCCRATKSCTGSISSWAAEHAAETSRAVPGRCDRPALDAGVTLFDTAALYGFGVNEDLVGKILSKHRNQFTLASKGGVAGVQFEDGIKRVIDGRPAAIRKNCEDSLRRLRTDVIDLYYLHRWDKKVPVEDSVGAISDLVRAGKVRSIGLSE